MKFLFTLVTRLCSPRLWKNGFVENFGIDALGQDCVILGNGPSLKQSLADSNVLEFIKKRKIFCVNSFAKSEYFWSLRPEFLVIIDNQLWNKSPNGCAYDELNLLRELLLNVSWELTIFMPKQAQKWSLLHDLPQSNKNIHIVYIEIRTPRIMSFFPFKHVAYRLNCSMPMAQNVLVSVLYLAINARFKNVYIFGADHSWFEELQVRSDNILCVRQKHFYDEAELVPFWKDDESSITFTMSEIMGIFATAFSSYEELEKYAHTLDVNIYNSSALSYIDAFKRLTI